MSRVRFRAGRLNFVSDSIPDSFWSENSVNQENFDFEGETETVELDFERFVQFSLSSIRADDAFQPITDSSLAVRLFSD